MCGKNLNPFGNILLWALLLLVAWSLPLYSQETVLIDKADWVEIQAQLSDLRKDLADLSLINDQQASRIRQLQETINQQAPLLTAQKINLIDLTQSLENTKTINTVLTTAGIVSLLANIVQAIAYQLKP